MIDWEGREDAGLLGALTLHARESPGRVAIDDDGSAITYSELLARCSRLAQALTVVVSPESRVGLLFDRPADYAIAMVSSLMAGRCFVPLDARYDARNPLTDLDVWLGRRTSRLYGVHAGTWHALEDLLATPLQPAKAAADRRANGAYVLFTSGSTGKAKGVEIQSAQLNAYVPAVSDRLALTPQDRWWQFASPSFDVFIEEFLPILSSGGTLICPSRLSTPTFDAFHQSLIQSVATVVELPTRYFSEYVNWLQERRVEPPRTLRWVLVGGEHMPVQPYRTWQKQFPWARLAHVYGVTEATVTSTIFQGTLSDHAQHVPVGTPLACAVIRIVDVDPDTGLGEIVIEGPAVGAGYVNDAAATEMRFSSSSEGVRRYRTGDLGRIVEEQLVLAGRVDDEVKLDGHRVNLTGIEQAISEVTGAPCVVIRTSKGNVAAFLKSSVWPGNQHLHVVPIDRRRRIVADLVLPSWAMPTEFYELSDLPSNGHGKADRAALRALLTSQASASSMSRRAPEDHPMLSQTERSVLAAFREALESAEFGFEDDFFEWGGDSLAAVRLTSALEELLAGNAGGPELLVDASTPALMSRLCRPSATELHLGEGQVLQLFEEEAHTLASMAVDLANRFGTSDDPDLLSVIRRSLGRTPTRLREEVRRFVESDEAPYLVVSGHVIDDERIGATPDRLRTRGASCRALAEEVLIAVYGELIGRSFSWETQQDGRLVHDVFPVRKHEFAQLGTGSRELLTWHTEDAFHPDRADFVLLLALRNPDAVATTVGTLRGWHPEDAVYETLFEERFIILPDESHLPENNSPDVVQTSTEGFDEVLQLRGNPLRIAVLFGDKARPKLRLDPYFMTPAEGDDDARRALTSVVQAIDERLVNVTLRAGDLLILNNARAVHGRPAFKARFDGTDRWLKRLNVRL